MLQETEIRLNSEITKLRSEQSQSVLNIQQLETQLNSLESQNMQLINEKENLMQTIELTISERDKLQAECDRLTNELDELNRKNSLDSNRLIDFESRLQRSDQEMKDLENKLEHTGKLLSKSKSDHDHQIKSLEEQLIAKYESILDEGHRDFDAKKKEFIETKTKLEFRLADNQKEITSLKNDLEQCKLAWNKEKKELISKQDEEFENNVKELEKRFQEDYSLFMQTHKESIQRTLNEKTQEFTREKESLIEIYEKKIADLESNEKSLLQKIREFRSPAPAPIVHKPRLLEVKCQTDPTDDSAEEEIEQLLKK